MATAIQRRRGNTAQHASFTGLAGEITIDTDKNTVVVHDGTTAGGYPLAKASDVEALGGADITAVIAGNGLTGGASSGNATIDIGAGTGIIVNADNVAVDMSVFSTSDLAEGTNLYFTAARARGNISVGGDLSYDSANGIISFTERTDAEVRGLVSVTDAGGDGSLSYDNSTGVITYTGPSQSEANSRIDARLSGTNGITYSSGAISVNAGYFDVAAGGTGFAANFEPSANNTYSLGSASNVWKDVYVGPGSLYINGQQVLSDNSGTITVSADAGQNLSIVTSNGGDLELSSGTTGDIQLKSNVVLSSGKTITATGGLKLASNLDVNSQYINNVSNPVNAQDAATKHYVDNDASVVRVTGTQVIAGDKTFSNNIIVNGNLTVSGTTVTVNSETISLADNIIDLNSNFTTGSPTENAGIRIKRGDSADVLLRWNETDDRWQFTNDGAAYANMLTETDVEGFFSVTDSGGDGSLTYANGVFTYTGPSATEVRAHLSAGTGLSYSSGQFSITNTAVSAGVYGSASAVPQVTVNEQGQITSASNVTISISSGQVSDFATAARGNISVTDAGGDGSMSYDSSTGVITYTGPSATEANAHIDARLSGGTGVTYTSGVIAIGQAVGTGDSVTFAGITGPLTGNVTGTVSSLANHDTADLAEGTNLYFTAARARGNISVTDSGGDGSLSYDNSTGVITYTGPSATEVRAHFSAGTGVSLSSGVIAIGQAVGTSDNVSFNNVTATANFIGNLTGSVTGSVSGNAGTATKLATARTIALSGDVTGSATFDGSANATITATIAANSVALGTDTTGNYVASVANGNYITGGSAGSEGATLTLAVDATTTATASKVAARDASGDLYANIFQGTATSARYADLAERYEADAILEPGTVVCFGGEKEITACDHENDHAVAGVVSTDPAYMMNSAAGNNDTHPYIALTGRVPVKVVGPVAKGDLLVASGVKGHAMANNNAKAGTIIGKAIGSSDSGEGVVEALINLM